MDDLSAANFCPYQPTKTFHEYAHLKKNRRNMRVATQHKEGHAFSLRATIYVSHCFIEAHKTKHTSMQHDSGIPLLREKRTGPYIFKENF